MNSQNTETKIKHTKFTIKLQLSYTPARAWPHRFHVRLMADTFVPLYLSLHDLHGLSNLNRTKYHSEGLSPPVRCGRARSDVFDGPACRGISEVKRTFGFFFRCSVVEVKKISPAAPHHRKVSAPRPPLRLKTQPKSHSPAATPQQVPHSITLNSLHLSISYHRHAACHISKLQRALSFKPSVIRKFHSCIIFCITI